MEYRIGIDLGGTNIKVGVVDENGVLVGKKSGGTDPYNRTWQDVVADMANLVKQILSENDIDVKDCVSMGIASPGMIDTENGVVVFASNFDWINVPILSEMRNHFPSGFPMQLANDADVAVFGEVVNGAAKDSSHVVMFTLGTGVGSGVVVDARPQAGGAGRMEFGHVTIAMDGEECSCGQKGCLEAYASATALIRDAKRAAEKDKNSAMWRLCEGNLENMNGRIPFIAANEGDSAAKTVVDNYIKYVGITVVNAVNIWRPDKVLLGGGIANEGEAFISAVRDYVHGRIFAGERGKMPQIMRAELGNDAGIYGAAAL